MHTYPRQTLFLGLCAVILGAIVVAVIFSPIASGDHGQTECTYAGTWSTNFGNMTLVQTGAAVTGTYTNDDGRIEGTVQGNSLTGRWSEAPTYEELTDAGDIQYLLDSGCENFTGSWRYGSVGPFSTNWNGSLISRGADALPSPRQGAATNCSFSGEWDTTFGVMNLVQSGSGVTGNYTFDDGRIEGTAIGNTLTAKWSEAPSYSALTGDAGEVEFVISSDCNTFTGIWRNTSSGNWTTGWNGTLVEPAAQTTGSSQIPPGAVTLTWVNFGDDRVGTWGDPSPNGIGEGHFQVDVNLAGSKILSEILLFTSDESGNPVFGQFWDTVPSGYWILGVYRDSVRLNPTDINLSDGVSGSASYQIYGDDSGFFKAPQFFAVTVKFTDGTEATAVELAAPPSVPTATPRPTPTPRPAATSTPAPDTQGSASTSGVTLLAESWTIPPQETGKVPILLQRADDVGNMDFILTYDPAVAEVVNVDRGSLMSGALFLSNSNVPGTVEFGFASTSGVNNNGSVAVVEFRAVGPAGSSTSLVLSISKADNVSGAPIGVASISGLLTIQQLTRGDGNGDSRVTELDALMALQMSVGLRDEDLVLDVDGDGRVTSADARILLRQAVSGSTTTSGRGGDTSTASSRPLPDVVLQIRPGAVLLHQGRTTETLTVQAFNSRGDEIPTDNLAIEWVSSNSAMVNVAPDPGNGSTAIISASNSIGTGMITARLKDEPRVVANLVAVTRAKLHPEVVLVADEDVAFPPVNFPEGVNISPSQIPGFTPSTQGGEARFGGFSESELADLFEITDEYEVRYPLVLRGESPAVGQRLLASHGAAIAGIVLSAERRGDYSLIQLRVGAPQELFEELKFNFSVEGLMEAGLLAPIDTSAWETDANGGTARNVGAVASAGNGKTAAPLSQPGKFPVGPFDCKASALPTFTQSPVGSNTYVGPIWDGSIEVGFFEIKRFYFKVGVQATATFNPEIRISKGVTVRVTCDLKPELRKQINLPTSFMTGPIGVLLSPYVEVFPSIPIVATLSGGSTARFGAKVGFDYAYWTGATYTKEGGWKALCETREQCSRTNSGAELIWKHDTTGNQFTIEGEAGAFGAAEAGLQAAGTIFGIIDSLPRLGTILEGRIASLKARSKVPIIRLRLGAKARIRWHNSTRTAFIENSEASADVVATGDVSLRLDALNSYLSTVLKLGGVRTIPVFSFPEIPISAPYRALNEETLTVNGEKVSAGFSAKPVQVKVGDTVGVRSTVEREFLGLSLAQIFVTGDSPHIDFPHMGEIWVNGRSIATMTPSNEFTLIGTFEATEALCEQAEESKNKSITVQLLAYNKMFGLIPTSNYVGDFKLACEEVLSPQVDAGSNQSVDLADTVSLSGTVYDDGTPDPPGAVTVTWSKSSGPGTATFGDIKAEQTTAKFSETGLYVLELTASDGESEGSDTVTIFVGLEPAEIPETGGESPPGPTAELPPDKWAVYEAGSIGLFVDVDDPSVVGEKETCRLAYGGLCGSGFTLADKGFSKVMGSYFTRDDAMGAICAKVTNRRYVLGVSWGTYEGGNYAVGNLRC